MSRHDCVLFVLSTSQIFLLWLFSHVKLNVLLKHIKKQLALTNMQYKSRTSLPLSAYASLNWNIWFLSKLPVAFEYTRKFTLNDFGALCVWETSIFERLCPCISFPLSIQTVYPKRLSFTTAYKKKRPRVSSLLCCK